MIRPTCEPSYYCKSDITQIPSSLTPKIVGPALQEDKVERGPGEGRCARAAGGGGPWKLQSVIYPRQLEQRMHAAVPNRRSRR